MQKCPLFQFFGPLQKCPQINVHGFLFSFTKCPFFCVHEKNVHLLLEAALIVCTQAGDATMASAPLWQQRWTYL